MTMPDSKITPFGLSGGRVLTTDSTSISSLDWYGNNETGSPKLYDPIMCSGTPFYLQSYNVPVGVRFILWGSLATTAERMNNNMRTEKYTKISSFSGGDIMYVNLPASSLITLTMAGNDKRQEVSVYREFV